jgi:hypothetical protein
MRKRAFILLLLSMVLCRALSAETMTPDRFREIVATPGDNVPLEPKLAAVPLWTNSVVSNDMKYENGKMFKEEMPQTAKTIGGKYVVFSTKSTYYHQVMNGILAYDKGTETLKVYGLFGDGRGGDVVTEGTVVYDFDHKTFSINSTYGNFKEITTGSYSEIESSEKTLVYKDEVLFMTREAKTHLVIAKKEIK